MTGSFFADGAVIAKCSGCETWPHVELGKWQREGADIEVAVKQEWFGYGRGRIVQVASGYVWEDYVAFMRLAPQNTVTLRKKTFKAEYFAAAEGDGCESARKHDMPPDPHAFLRQFDGEHPETFQRVLQRADLKSMSAQEFHSMRDEVFARYGYRFKDPLLAARYAKVKGISATWMTSSRTSSARTLRSSWRPTRRLARNSRGGSDALHTSPGPPARCLGPAGDHFVEPNERHRGASREGEPRRAQRS